MADDLPEDFDVIVLGTGFPESVVAAALSRIGMKVLHLDRNDYYSDQWVTFTFESLLKWIELNQAKDEPDAKEVDDMPEAVGTHTNEPPSLETGTYSIPVPSHSSEISNVVVRAYFSEKQPEETSEKQPEETSEKQSEETSEGQPKETSEKHSKETSEKQAEETSEKQAEETSDKQAEETSEKQAEETSEKQAEETSEKQPEETSEKQPEETSEKQPEETSEKQEETSEEQPKETSEKHSKETSEKHSKETNEKQPEETSKKQPEETSEKQPEETNEVLESADNGAEEMLKGEDEVKDSGDLVQVPFVPPQKAKNERRPPICTNMTYDDLKPYWRRFNIDISPKLLFSRGPLVEALISANISHYAEFKSVTRILTYMDGRIEEVPCSRADVFSSNVISIVEKRMLMKFLTFCLDFEQQQDQYQGLEEQPYTEFLQSRRLTPNLQHFIIHAIAMVKPETPTLQGLKATQNFLQSLGRYGNTPFIWPLYGAGEMPQAFCRMCAVFGGLYCLRRYASAITISEENNECNGVIANNQLLKCKQLILGHSYVPESFRKECTQFVSRAVFITCSSLKASEEEFITVLSVPPSSPAGEPVRVIELGPATMACPKGLYVVHFVCKSSFSAKEDLEPTATKLFHFPSEGNMTGGKPTVLWSLYFNQANPDPSCVTNLPSNVHVLSLPGISLGFGEALQQAKEVFEKICPDEEFLQAVPNPEDIILDDFLQDGNHNTAELASGAQADAVDPASGNEERPTIGTVQEQAEGDNASSEPGDDDAQVDADGREESLTSGTGQVQAEASRQPSEEEPFRTGQEQAEDVDVDVEASRQPSGEDASRTGQEQAETGKASRQPSEGEASRTGQEQAETGEASTQPSEEDSQLTAIIEQSDSGIN